MVWTRVTVHNGTSLNHTCHLAYISVRVFDMTVYWYFLIFNFCKCFIWKLYFQHTMRFLAINNVTWYADEFFPPNLLISNSSIMLKIPPLILFIKKTVINRTKYTIYYMGSFVSINKRPMGHIANLNNNYRIILFWNV